MHLYLTQHYKVRIKGKVEQSKENGAFVLHLTTLAYWVECSSMGRETWIQSRVASYQRLLKWYLIPPCLTPSNIRYVLRVKWSNPEKGVAPSPTPWCSSYWKGSLLVALDYGHHLYLITICVRVCVCVCVCVCGYIYIYIYICRGVLKQNG